MNLDANAPVDFAVRLRGQTFMRAEGEVLTGPRVDAINSFDAPDAVRPAPYAVRAAAGALPMHLTPKSLTVVRLLP